MVQKAALQHWKMSLQYNNTKELNKTQASQDDFKIDTASYAEKPSLATLKDNHLNSATEYHQMHASRFVFNFFQLDSIINATLIELEYLKMSLNNFLLIQHIKIQS